MRRRRPGRRRHHRGRLTGRRPGQDGEGSVPGLGELPPEAGDEDDAGALVGVELLEFDGDGEDETVTEGAGDEDTVGGRVVGPDEGWCDDGAGFGSPVVPVVGPVGTYTGGTEWPGEVGNRLELGRATACCLPGSLRAECVSPLPWPVWVTVVPARGSGVPGVDLAA